jgi:hypothetical protein
MVPFEDILEQIRGTDTSITTDSVIRAFLVTGDDGLSSSHGMALRDGSRLVPTDDILPEAAKFDLVLTISDVTADGGYEEEDIGGWRCQFGYNTSAFDRGTIEVIAQRFVYLCNAVMLTPAATFPLSSTMTQSAMEMDIISSDNNKKRDWGPVLSIPAAVLQWGIKTPKAPALWFEGNNFHSSLFSFSFTFL